MYRVYAHFKDYTYVQNYRLKTKRFLLLVSPGHLRVGVVPDTQLA